MSTGWSWVQVAEIAAGIIAAGLLLGLIARMA